MRSDLVRAVAGFLKRLVVAEVLALGLYMLITSLGYYPRLWLRLGLTNIISYEIAHVVFFFLAQVVIIAAVFWWWRRKMMKLDPGTLAVQPEHERLERKSTLRWDIAAGKVNKSLERAAMKTVAAFLNTKGGHLVIGVGDDGAAVGLERDCATLARKDTDGLVNHFGNVFNTLIGAHVRHLVQLRTFTYREKPCILVSVGISPRPVYLADEGKEEFFIRTGNSTTSLKLSEAQAYIDTHWHKKK